MFREMKRKQNELPRSEAIEMLKTSPHGILSTIGDDGYPYGVPVSFVHSDDKIIFHCASTGHKLDAIMKNEKVSFCVVQQDNIIPEDFNTLYRSTIAFGKARILKETKEIEDALVEILRKYSPNFIENGKKYIDAEWDNVKVVEIAIEHLTAKAGD